MVTHCDIVNCLAQLNDLKQVDHSSQIEKGGLSAHVKVCANMRAKLVSEVKTNHEKLKVSLNENDMNLLINIIIIKLLAGCNKTMYRYSSKCLSNG